MAREKFAKLFETREYGQLLVKQDEGENGPEIRVYFMPECLGVCSVAIQFKDDDEGWDKCDRTFKLMDRKEASKMVENVELELLQTMAGC